ncbi:MAG: M17 family peptidase N-terminal domain-containing protein, partial [Gemmatimonadota bacterium]
MRIAPQAVAPDPANHDTPLLVVPVLETDDGAALPDLPDPLDRIVREGVGPDDLRGGAGSSRVVWTSLQGGPRRLLLLGVGRKDDLKGEAIRRFAGHAVRKAEDLRIDALTLWLPDPAPVEAGRAAQSLAEGGILAAWRFGELKTGRGGADDEEPPPEVASIDVMVGGDRAEVEDGVAVGTAMARGQNFARTLQSRPGNVATPSHLAEQASAVGGE